MIVLPNRLNELLNDVDEQRAALIAVDFAEHAIQIQASLVHPRLLEVTTEYLSAGREAISAGRAHQRLIHADEEYFRASWEFASRFEPTQLGNSAVMFGCQRMLEEAGARSKAARVNPTCQYIARTAQSHVGRWHAKHAAEGADRRRADRAARWEEARWQLLHVISLVPNPFEGGDGEA
ncbi:hypothetical protein GR925_02935 [Streptomyces sp. HUCO-GS316]|uniref:hypothetical protein n=1 Tax=Streptomyces sp. HUCO-GS316 TaxID=2692198 RepID=UPI00136DB1B2|nr:hypothetical protein [Streptomyces sp. HUCO-GS316]MXM62429.1 hypothetical protein [Streptomyces sp. HUCO-GS316]